MIIDCFPFFDELDILEIRLEELYPVVDKFVICESTKTHTGIAKDLNFLLNKDRYEKYLDKIIYIVCDDMPEGQDDWKRENYQRNYLTKGLIDTAPGDLIFLSDCDEIPNRASIKDILEYFNNNPHNGPLTLQFHCYYGKIGHRVIHPKDHEKMKGTIVIPYGCDISNFQNYRNNKDSYPSRYYGGWHFSYIGDAEKIKKKIESYAHSEFNTPEVKEKIQERLNNNQDLLGRQDFIVIKMDIDDTYPVAVINNIEKYRNII